MSRRSDNPAAKIIVRNYPLTSTDKEFKDMFEKIGKIDDCKSQYVVSHLLSDKSGTIIVLLTL